MISQHVPSPPRAADDRHQRRQPQQRPRQRPKRLGALLDRIIADAPNALLAVARLTPTTNGRVQTYNNAIPGLIQTRAAAGKHIVMVDMYAAFTATTSYKTTLMNDELHPNNAGYVAMSSAWYAAIRSYLPGR